MIFKLFIGMSKNLINNLMSLELGESYTWEEYGLDIRDTAITWLNDLETDERYRRWPSSYMELLRPTYPGMLRNLRRNIYNYVSRSSTSSQVYSSLGNHHICEMGWPHMASGLVTITF